MFKKINNRYFNPDNILVFLVVLSVSYSAYLALAFSNQPPLDLHAPRQTQTALAAYWFFRDGFRFAYDTPVAGVPWSIPFEFPLYQFVVSLASKSIGVSLDVSGRLTSYLFFVLCVFPVRSITRILRLPESVFLVFLVLVFSAPIYVYWSRTFMIETAALFFSVVSVKYFLEALRNRFCFKDSFLFVSFITLSILQKSTTGLPVLGVLSVVFLISQVRKAESINDFLFGRTALVAFSCFAIPLVIGGGWVYFTDQVKSLNPLGVQLTSSALGKWNWGTFGQRISSDLIVKVLWERVFVTNIGGLLGVCLVCIPFFLTIEPRLKKILLVSIILGIAPLFLFSNLHIVHYYYQAANVMFLIYAIAVVFGCVFFPSVGYAATIPVLLLIVISNYVALFGGYVPQIKHVFTKENRDLAVGEILKREIPEGGQFVAFGNDWSSSFAYVSERKSFNVPEWFSKYDEAKSNPEKFVEQGRLGAVVSCSVKSPNISDLLLWSLDKRSWKVGETNGCFIASAQKPFNAREAKLVQCQGNIDRAEIEVRDGVKIVSISGWSTFGMNTEIPENVYVTLSGINEDKVYMEALRVPRLDINSTFGLDARIDAGFSLIIPARFAPGEYEVGISQFKGGLYQSCQIKTKLLVPY